MRGRTEALALWRVLDAEYDRYKAAIGFIPVDQARLQEDLRRYLCLRCAGFLEQLAFVVISDYLIQKSSGPPLAFTLSYWRQAPNMNRDAFIRLIGRFGEPHAGAFENFLTTARAEALGDLLAIRNDVAHGKVFNQRLDPQRYVALCEDIYEWMVETFLGDSVEVLDAAGHEVTSHEHKPS